MTRGLLSICCSAMLLSTAGGCATRGVLRYAHGYARTETIDRVERAWSASNRVCVAVQGTFARTTGGHLLCYELPGAGSAAPEWRGDVALLDRSHIRSDAASPAESGGPWAPLEVSRHRGGIWELSPNGTFYLLSDAERGSVYVLTGGALLGFGLGDGLSMSDWERRRWLAFQPLYRNRFWADLALPVAVGADAVLGTGALGMDLLFALGGANTEFGFFKAWMQTPEKISRNGLRREIPTRPVLLDEAIEPRR